MSFLRTLKLTALRAACASGLNSLVLDSPWRKARLLILCYHGVSLQDEHEWRPALFMPPALFRERMETLRRARCALLPLGEALDRLASGRLPQRAVVLTFDDGGYDFYRVAYPILREYGFPATVYLTTYYAAYNRPVFDVMVSYLLWKARGRTLDWPEVLRRPLSLDDAGRAAASRQIIDAARRGGWCARERDSRLESLAGRLDVSYAALCAQRLLHLMTLDEARELAATGSVDVQLHTHRHRVSRNEGRFVEEIEDNRRALACVSAIPAVHFCYPGGYIVPEFEGYLRRAGIQSAVTCEQGLAERGTNRYFLPRFLDSTNTSRDEFAAIVSGLASLLPARRLPPNEAQRTGWWP